MANNKKKNEEKVEEKKDSTTKKNDNKVKETNGVTKGNTLPKTQSQVNLEKNKADVKAKAIKYKSGRVNVSRKTREE